MPKKDKQEEQMESNYQKWVGQQGNSSMGTQANKAGYKEYQAEQKRKQADHDSLRNAANKGSGGKTGTGCMVALITLGALLATGLAILVAAY
jgi:hypothetical protein